MNPQQCLCFVRTYMQYVSVSCTVYLSCMERLLYATHIHFWYGIDLEHINFLRTGTKSFAGRKLWFCHQCQIPGLRYPGESYIYIYVILYFRWISHKQFLNLFKYIQVENQMVFKHINHIQSLIFATGYGSIFSVQELLSPVDQGPPVLHLIGVLTGVRMLGLEWVFPICMGQGCGKECHRESCYFQKIPGILEWNFGREQHRFRHGFSKIRMYSKLLMN